MAEIDCLSGRFALDPVEQTHKRTSGQGGLLGLAHLRCRHHLHRFGDLRGAADGPDLSA
jgi:hypothetical protein